MKIDFYKRPFTRKSCKPVHQQGSLLLQAKIYHTNLSNVLENRLVEILAEAKRRGWKEESRHAIDAYNRRVQESGVFSEILRKF